MFTGCSPLMIPEAPPAFGAGVSLIPGAPDGSVRHHLATDQRSAGWHGERSSRLTASSIAKVLNINTSTGAYKPRAREEAFYEKLGITEPYVSDAMKHGTHVEPLARQRYTQLTRNQVYSCGFVTYQEAALSSGTTSSQQQLELGPETAWLGGSPDGIILKPQPPTSEEEAAGAAEPGVAAPGTQSALVLAPGSLPLERAGVLEIKCPKSKGITAHTNWIYVLQIEALMQMVGLGWAHLFVYSAEDDNAFMLELERDPGLWALVQPLLHSFWFDHVLPARQALQRHEAELKEMEASLLASDPGMPSFKLLKLMQGSREKIVEPWKPNALDKNVVLELMEHAEYNYNHGSPVSFS